MWLLTLGRPDTVDSTEERNPGDGRLYPVGEITPSAGCWSQPPQSIGYPEALGITFDQHVVIVDEAVDREFADRTGRSERHGFTPAELDLRGVVDVAVFPIVTAP